MALQHPAFLNCLSVVDKAAMGNHTVGKSVVDSVDRGSVDGVGNNRGVVDNWVGNSVDGVDRGVVDNWVGNSVDGVDRGSGNVDGVRSSHGTGAIVGLGLLEVGLGVVIGHGVGVGVGGGLSEVGGSDGVHHRGGSVLGGGGRSSDHGKGDEGLHVECVVC